MISKKMFAMGGALLLASFAAFGQGANDQKLIKMTDDLAASFAANDAATLDKVLTDDFLKTAASVNRAQPKAQFVGGLKSGRQKYVDYKLSNEKVQGYEGSGVVTADADFHVINGSNPVAENHEVITAIWVQQAGPGSAPRGFPGRIFRQMPRFRPQRSSTRPTT